MAKEGGQQNIRIPKDYNSCLYLIKGTVNIKGYGMMDAENLVIFEDDGDEITMHFQKDSQFLLLSGAPISEPITQFGPYVMNTQTEIMEAMRDYQMGKMGVLIEEE